MFDFVNGEILLFDKPYTWTSFDVVRLIKNCLKKNLPVPVKVGHAGTLDPLATGMLIVLTGKKTRDMELIQAQEKEYIGTFTVGATTPSFDRETDIDQTFQINHLTDELIYNTAKTFVGEIMQFPPAHSAVKVDGKRAYEYARKSKDVEIKPRPVIISEFEITRIDLPEIDFRVVCSKGTYIRSLAHDFGKALDAGAYLSSLCRTRIGEYKLEDAMHPKEFTVLIEKLKEEKAI